MTQQSSLPCELPEPGAVFDYAAPAEMYMAQARRGPLVYRRFDTAALALQFAMETMPAPLLAGTVIEVLEERFDHRAIRDLYGRTGYPLVRH